jgi:hypothetical protein
MKRENLIVLIHPQWVQRLKYELAFMRKNVAKKKAGK